ncbi:MAG: serine/threonine-protein kinase, partial [Tahibacter sp.]
MSDAARWARIKHLFHQSQEQPETEREHWLTDQCGDDEDLLREIRGLLGAQRASHDILDAGAVGVLRQIGTGELTPDLSGQRIGAYRLLRLIGEGGMGSVFLAERDGADFSQRVALKLIRADFVSAETSARFLRERNFLARLVHPHIAQLHDGGVAADGTPYFTLEYVEGAPITKYCDAHALDIRGRLQLILQVCAAVSYAHRNLIVHRDLKPSNILVAADGTAKLLDFGIAKLLDTEPGDGHTATHARMMTPEYAAPEQVLGEPITTATDVYSIGVLLYELLCGRLPYARADAGVISWSKAVVEETPEPVYRALTRLTTRGASATGDAAAAARGTVLPTLRRSLRGDLDRILQRALAKSPEARYSSVSAFAADISAHLDGNAISGGTRTYQMRKFLRRHWLPLVASSAILLLAVISAIAMAWQAARIEREAKTTAVVKDFLIGLFNAVDPNAAKGKEVTARELLDRGKTSINAMPSNDPQVKGELQSVLGRIDFQLGNYAEAGELQRQAIETLRTSADGLRQMIATELDRAETLRIAGNLKDAQGMIDAAAADLQQASQPLIGERARLLITRSNATMQKHHFDEAMPDAAAAVALLRPVGNADGQLELALENVGNIELGRHALDAAETNYREALQLALQRQGPDGLMVASLHINLGWVLAERSRYEEDLIETRQGLDIESRVLGAEHPRTLIIQMQTGTILYHLGHYAQAREL